MSEDKLNLLEILTEQMEVLIERSKTCKSKNLKSITNAIIKLAKYINDLCEEDSKLDEFKEDLKEISKEIPDCYDCPAQGRFCDERNELKCETILEILEEEKKIV